MIRVCLAIIDVKCYCEHQNETSPLNGIICGSEGSIQKRAGYCGYFERCTGPNDPSQGVELAKRQRLCSIGEYTIIFDIQETNNICIRHVRDSIDNVSLLRQPIHAFVSIQMKEYHQMESCVETLRRETMKGQVIVAHMRDVPDQAIQVRESMRVVPMRHFAKLVGYRQLRIFFLAFIIKAIFEFELN